MNLFNSNSDNSNDIFIKNKLRKNIKKKIVLSSNSDNNSNATIKCKIEKKTNRKKRLLCSSSSDNNSDLSKKNKIGNKRKKEKCALFTSDSDNNSDLSKKNKIGNKRKKEKSTLFSSNSDNNSIPSTKSKNKKKNLFFSNSDSSRSTPISKTINKKENIKKLKRYKQNISFRRKSNDKLSNTGYENRVEFTKIKSCNDHNFKNQDKNFYEEKIFKEKSSKFGKANNSESDLTTNISKGIYVNKKKNCEKFKDFGKLQNDDDLNNDYITELDKNKRNNNLRTLCNKNDKNSNGISDNEGLGVYRLINFEKFKKRACRNLNFLSIVDITRTHSESDEKNEESEKNSDEDILNLTDNSESSLKHNEISHNSFFSNSYQSSIDSECSNRTLDIYNYYYLDNNNSPKDENLEKLIYNSNKYYDLDSYLFRINEKTSQRSEKEEAKGNKEHSKNVEKDKKESENDYKISKEYKKNKGINFNNDDNKKKLLLKKNIILYRNFKNINNKISRKNNIKGLYFKEMVSNFIRIINKNVLTMNKEENKKKKKKSNYNNISDDTSEVESAFNLESNNEEDAVLQKAQCLCLFCSEKKKILNKNELDLIIFKYIEANKEDNTVIKPFFLDNYIFVSFLNFSIHHKNIVLCDKKKNIKKLKNSRFYKYSINMKKKYRINKIIHFVAEKIILTTLALYIHGSNFLNDKEQFIAVINFLKWKKIRKNYFEILKLKRNKENLKIYKNCSFLINAIDKFCSLNNINMDDIIENNAKKKKVKSKMYDKKDFFINNNKFSDNSLLSQNEFKTEQIENSLNINLKNSNLQFLFVDPLYVPSKKTFHLYPSHIIILF